MKSLLNVAHFANEEAALAYVESRLWPNGPACPHCGAVGEASRSKGKTTRPGLWNCRACRRPFTVKIGTVFEFEPCPATYLAADDLSVLFFEEGVRHAPATAHPWMQHENRLVPRASSSRGDERSRHF